MAYFLGIDIGTSSAKAGIYDPAKGKLLGVSSTHYEIRIPTAGYAEQDPEEWWIAAVISVRRVLQEAGVAASAVAAIGFSGQMHSTVCLDRAGKPVMPAILWADTRSGHICKAFLQNARREEILTYAPGPPVAGFMAATLAWLAENQPDLLEKTAVVMLPKDYVRYRMTAEIATDISDAASTWLLDIRSGHWSAWLADWSGVDINLLPPVHESKSQAGVLRPKAADALGMPSGIPVITGCADQPAQALGHGIASTAYTLLTIGTGGQVFYPVAEPVVDPLQRFHVFNHAVDGQWYALAAMLTAGLSLQWLKSLIGDSATSDYTELSSMAGKVSPGSDGLLYLPYLAGERTPHIDADASGAFVGMRLHHGKAHFIRAVMEGVAFALADCLHAAKSLVPGSEPRKVILSGGGAVSPVWRQILADVLNTTLWIAEGQHHACAGAAMLAAVGSGFYQSIEDACKISAEPQVAVTPLRENAELYAQRYEQYKQLYPRLRDL